MRPVTHRVGLLTLTALIIAAAGMLARPPVPASAARPPNLQTRTITADATGYSAEFTFPDPAKVEHFEQLATGASGMFVRLVLPDTDSDNFEPNAVGSPEIPFYRRIIAAPRGTTNIRFAESKRGLREDFTLPQGTLLYPIQDQAVDQSELDPAIFADPPFQWNPSAYRTDIPVPTDGDLIRITPLGTVRDLEMFALDMAVAQYNPAAGIVRIFSGLTLDLTFILPTDSDGTFLDTAMLNPFEDQVTNIYAGAINYSAVLSNLKVRAFEALPCYGSEFLIVTPPEFRAAADTLRTWKVAKGISTVVVETGAGVGKAGTTKEQIRDYIRNRYNTCGVRLSYVLLLADADRIAPFMRTADGKSNLASDLDYSLKNDVDILPDLAVGRISVDTLAQAQIVVDKIVAYEKSPPFAPSFYRNTSIASFFQCCRTDIPNPNGTANKGTDMRWFIETSELVRQELVDRGYTTERIYDTNTGYAEAAVTDTTPRRYYNGTPLPAALAPGTFAWDGDTTDVINAINAGRFLVLHRDHGGTSGWGDPAFSTGNLGSLTNGSRLPVIFSVNCASGNFDADPTESFVEQVLRKEGGGAVGVLGDTRNSPTIQNNALTRGFYDAIWPDTLPGYGGSGSIRRLGDILNYGKAYMVSEYGITNEKVKLEMAIWTTYGDPTMEMWTNDPYRFTSLFATAVVKEKLPNRWIVSYAQDDAVITALQDGLPIGRATVKDGEAVIDFLNPPIGDSPIELSASAPDAVSTPLFQGAKVYMPLSVR